MLKQSISLVPARRDFYQAKLVFYLFIASLTVFFVASLITYCVIRVESFRSVQFRYDYSTDAMKEVHWSYESLQLPVSFWFSTLVLVAISILLQRACWFVHREHQEKFRRCLMWAWALAVVFMFIQSFGLVELINRHFNLSGGAQVYDGSTKVYGMSFALALIHALHVVGGLGFLGFVIFQAFRGRYDHERHWAVDHCAGYWHFLDCVWVSMLIVFAVIQ